MPDKLIDKFKAKLECFFSSKEGSRKERYESMGVKTLEDLGVDWDLITEKVCKKFGWKASSKVTLLSERHAVICINGIYDGRTKAVFNVRYEDVLDSDLRLKINEYVIDGLTSCVIDDGSISNIERRKRTVYFGLGGWVEQYVKVAWFEKRKSPTLISYECEAIPISREEFDLLKHKYKDTSK